jgi:hypothetical protein
MVVLVLDFLLETRVLSPTNDSAAVAMIICFFLRHTRDGWRHQHACTRTAVTVVCCRQRVSLNFEDVSMGWVLHVSNPNLSQRYKNFKEFYTIFSFFLFQERIPFALRQLRQPDCSGQVHEMFSVPEGPDGERKRIEV